MGVVAVALDQGVQMILRLEHARDAAVHVEEPDAPNRPVAAGFRQFVDVARQVGTVEAADADVQDSRTERRAVVVRHRDAATFDCPEVRRREPKRHVGERTRESSPSRSATASALGAFASLPSCRSVCIAAERALRSCSG